jgi:hypothetical protein
VLSGKGLCDELITRPEESYRLWCVVCDLETPRMRPRPAMGCSATEKKILLHIYLRFFNAMILIELIISLYAVRQGNYVWLN